MRHIPLMEKIPLLATCSGCGQQKKCLKLYDLGWVCSECKTAAGFLSLEERNAAERGMQ